MTPPTDMIGLLELMSGMPRTQIEGLVAELRRNNPKIDENRAALSLGAGMAAGGALAAYAAITADINSDEPELEAEDVEVVTSVATAGALVSIALTLLTERGQTVKTGGE